MVQELFTDHAAGVHIVVASRYEATAIYTIQKPGTEQLKKTPAIPFLKPTQLNLFDLIVPSDLVL